MTPLDAPLAGSLVVDGANVVGSRPDGWWRDRAGAATRLARRLDALAADQSRLRVTLVVEGQARETDAAAAPAITIVRAVGSGDAALVEVVTRLVADGEGPVVAVTSDRELAARVHTVGATVHGASWLWDLLDETSAR